MPARARSTAETGVLEVLCAQRLLPKAAWDLNRCMRGTLRPATEVRICSDNMMLLPSIFTFKRVRRLDLKRVLDDPLLSVSWPTSLEYLSIEGNAELEDVHLPPGLAVEELRVFVDDSRDREGAAWIERVLGTLRAGVLKTFRIRAEKFKTLATVLLPAGILQLELAHACMGSDGDPDDHPPFDKVKVPDSVTELFLDGISLQNVQVPSALNSLDMSCSGVFSSLPDQAFGEMTVLTRLCITDCTELSRLPDSIGNLSALTSVAVQNCSSFTRLPEAFGNLTALTSVDLTYCESLESLPESFVSLTALTELDLLSCTSLKSLPQLFGNLTALTALDLSWCKSLASLPESFSDLTALKRLRLAGCDELISKPETFEFSNLTALDTLNLGVCSLTSLPETLGNLTALTTLDLTHCKSLTRLPKSFGNLTALSELGLEGCKSLTSLTVPFGMQQALTVRMRRMAKPHQRCVRPPLEGSF
eukprot:TRINITY_DN546_c0_g1_i1.p1 TRINITY_DN546_c0_g1~~TRINITY_DN546_c0_g1_i1.p1  ORF type:complete len:476 (-),score=46.09 TRINITY_DN546_c0_g1_i1:13-1440(-)